MYVVINYLDFWYYDGLVAFYTVVEGMCFILGFYSWIFGFYSVVELNEVRFLFIYIVFL